MAAARKVFEATLSNYEKLPAAQQIACAQLFRAYAEAEMNVGENVAALRIYLYIISIS